MRPCLVEAVQDLTGIYIKSGANGSYSPALRRLKAIL